jgi:hypothetical protein
MGMRNGRLLIVIGVAVLIIAVFSGGLWFINYRVPPNEVFQRGELGINRSTIEYTIVYIEGMPCLVLLDAQGHITSDVKTCDWDQWEGRNE